jgi:hypothetical protein
LKSAAFVVERPAVVCAAHERAVHSTFKGIGYQGIMQPVPSKTDPPMRGYVEVVSTGSILYRGHVVAIPAVGTKAKSSNWARRLLRRPKRRVFTGQTW